MLVHDGNDVVSSFTTDGRTTTINIEEISEGYDGFWDIMASDSGSDIDTRIFKSVTWIGKALEDSDRSRSLLQLFIALESLFQYDPKDQIRPDLTHQLSEYVAFALETKLSARKALFKEMKNLYRLRSSIVHGQIIDGDRYTLGTCIGHCKILC